MPWSFMTTELIQYLTWWWSLSSLMMESKFQDWHCGSGKTLKTSTTTVPDSRVQIHGSGWAMPGLPFNSFCHQRIHSNLNQQIHKPVNVNSSDYAGSNLRNTQSKISLHRIRVTVWTFAGLHTSRNARVYCYLACHGPYALDTGSNATLRHAPLYFGVRGGSTNREHWRQDNNYWVNWLDWLIDWF